MCGIAGILTNRHPEDASERVGHMIAAMQHRGPDGNKVVTIFSHPKNCLVLGHARLSILDLQDTSSQPMVDSATRSWLVYNGEIYNFRELRHELESHGHQFVSTGDTEVVLKAIVHWKHDALRKFQGMFALAFWDGLERELTLEAGLLVLHDIWAVGCRRSRYPAASRRHMSGLRCITTRTRPSAAGSSRISTILRS